MHLSWRDLENLSREGKVSWRMYVRCPHLLFCSKCRRELRTHSEERALISNLKAAYVREEMIHTARTSRVTSRRS